MRVSDPGVDDPARVRGTVLQVVVDPAGDHLLGETHHVGMDPKVLVAPHCSGGPAPRLNLVHHQGYVPLSTDLLQSLEELRTGVVVSALGLDGFGYNPCHGRSVLALKENSLIFMLTHP